MAIPNASGFSQNSSRSEQAERVHTPPGLDDLSILEAVDRDAGNRDPPARWRYTPQLAGMGHLPTPTRNDLVALGNLVLNGELHVGEGVAIQLDRAFHPSQTLSGMGVIGIVVDDVSSDQLIKPARSHRCSRPRTPLAPLPCCAQTSCLVPGRDEGIART